MFIGKMDVINCQALPATARKIVMGSMWRCILSPFHLWQNRWERNYALKVRALHQFVDACLGNGETTAPFDYSGKITETILLGVIAGRFPNEP